MSKLLGIRALHFKRRRKKQTNTVHLFISLRYPSRFFLPYAHLTFSGDCQMETAKKKRGKKKRQSYVKHPAVRKQPQPQQKKDKLPFSVETFLPEQQYPLFSSWTLYAHFNKNTNYTLEDFIPICTFSTIGGFWTVWEAFKLHYSYNYFIMRGKTQPRWEDPVNAQGGAFSLQIGNARGRDLFLDALLFVLGETLFVQDPEQPSVVGVTLASNREITTVKVWCREGKRLESELPRFFQDTYACSVRFMPHQPQQSQALVRQQYGTYRIG